MSLPAIFENFVQQSPVTVMMLRILERVMSPEKLDELFERTAQQQYTRELLFSEVVELMMPVVTGRRHIRTCVLSSQRRTVSSIEHFYL